MSNNTLELADSVESDLIKQVLSLEEKSKEALTKSEAKIDRTALRSKDVLQVMESAAESVAKLNENILKFYPELRKTVGEKITMMDAELVNAKTALDMMKDAAMEKASLRDRGFTILTKRQSRKVIKRRLQSNVVKLRV